MPQLALTRLCEKEKKNSIDKTIEALLATLVNEKEKEYHWYVHHKNLGSAVELQYIKAQLFTWATDKFHIKWNFDHTVKTSCYPNDTWNQNTEANLIYCHKQRPRTTKIQILSKKLYSITRKFKWRWATTRNEHRTVKKSQVWSEQQSTLSSSVASVLPTLTVKMQLIITNGWHKIWTVKLSTIKLEVI